MAQVASKTCDICSSALTEHYCIDCEQYFCETCKGLHKRQRTTRNHEFQSSSDLIQEVKSKCKEHDEDFIFLCSSCDVPVCRRCMAGKHNGHKVANIDDSVANLTQGIKKAIHKKLHIATENLQQIESGLKAFDLDVHSIIKRITEEGQQIKARIDRVVQNMIDDINSKAMQECDKLKNIIGEAQTGLKDVTLLNLRKLEHEKTRRDASLLQKLKTLNSDITKFQPVTVPVLPSISYTSKGTSEQNLVNLFGTYSVSQTQSERAQPYLTSVKTDRSRTKTYQKAFAAEDIYRCSNCGHEITVSVGCGVNHTKINSSGKKQEERLNNPDEEILCIEQTVKTEVKQVRSETCLRKKREQSEFKDEQSNPAGNTNITSPDNFICPYCNKYVDEGIGCDRCDYWYHYQCENLSGKVGENELKQLDYICTLCNDDILYERRNITECDPSTEDDNIDICTNTENTQDEQEETQHNAQIRSRKELDPITISIDQEIPPRSYNIQNQMREKIDREETDLKLIFTPTTNERTEGTAKSKQRPVIGNETGPTINMAENVKEKRTNESLVKKNQKGTKSKNDKEETIIAQKTRILNLENEIKHMQAVLDTVTRREESQQKSARTYNRQYTCRTK